MGIILPRQNLDELPGKFPTQVEQEASRLHFTDELFENREEVHGFTIDAADSHDLDDAIQLRQTPDGWLADITISDVDSLISQESYVDIEALSRVSTQYYGQIKRNGQTRKFSVPMIPRILSEYLLSLHEGKIRPTLTAQIQLNQHGKILSTTIKKTFLASSKRLSHSQYEGTRIIGDPGLPMDTYLRFSRMLAQNRLSEGSLGFQELKKGINTDEEGMVIRGSVPAANQIVQEFMILANRSVADFFLQNKITAPFRIHAPASPASAPTRQQIIEEIEKTSNYLKLVDNLRSIFNKSLSAASYNSEADRHFGLELPAYLHFTSPIRRYADLINHRLAKAFIDEKPLPYSPSEVTNLCQYLNERTHRLITLRSIKSGHHSFHNYRQNLPRSTESSNPQYFDQLQTFLTEHHLGNPIFEFSARPGIHPELTCQAAVRFRSARHTATFTARADKETVKNQTAYLLLRKVKQLQDNYLTEESPTVAAKKSTNHFFLDQARLSTPVIELMRYCHEKNLPSPNFHYEIWSGGIMPITCYCQITKTLAVTGHGLSRVKSKYDASQKLLNYLQSLDSAKNT